MTAHRKTGTVATYRTRPGRMHEASTTTRHRGYDVATIERGSVIPGTLASYPTREAAIAEVERRARADYAASHHDGACPDCAGTGWRRVSSPDGIPSYWYCRCARGRMRDARDRRALEAGAEAGPGSA